MGLVDLAQSAIDYRVAMIVDAKHNREAVAGYRRIVEQDRGAALDRRTRAHIRAYAKEELGSSRFAAWLELYSAIYGTFVEGWIPDNYFARVVMPRVQDPVAKGVFGWRTITRRLLQTERLPDVVYHVRGSWLDPNGRPLAAEEVAAVVFRNSPTAFLKLETSARGDGISRLHRDTFDPAVLAGYGDFVIQTDIRQAGVFERVVPGAVTTVRVTTTKSFAAPARAHTGLVRFGYPGETGVEAKTEIIVPIVDDAGTLAAAGFRPDWSRCRVHPATGCAFAGLTVPSYAKIVRTCRVLHDTLPHLEVAGWDVAVDDTGDFHLLELNSRHIGINIIQAVSGPCFAEMGWNRLWRGG